MKKREKVVAVLIVLAVLFAIASVVVAVTLTSLDPSQFVQAGDAVSGGEVRINIEPPTDSPLRGGSE